MSGGDHVERLEAHLERESVPLHLAADLRAAVAELKQLRAERAKLTALADELQVATAQNRAAMTEWLDLRFGMSEDAVALVATDGRLIGTQVRRSEARQAWMNAATRLATLDERFAPAKRADCIAVEPAAPQQPARDGEAPWADDPESIERARTEPTAFVPCADCHSPITCSEADEPRCP